MTSFNRVAMLALALVIIASTDPAWLNPTAIARTPGEQRPFASATARPRNIQSIYGVTLRFRCTAPV